MEDIIVVIDPGHGGENLGADYNNVLEKDINLILAKALYDELIQYEGIQVYLTREDDIDLDLLERAEFADSVNADFLFCYHFNMSEEHFLFGTETWVCSQKDLYEPAASFSEIQIQSMVDLGLYSRGIKTKLNDKGTDYYGILRHSATFNIPAVLIEHGHLDHEYDSIYFDEYDELIQLGKIDATNIAKYFQLSSQSLGVDYSDFEVPVVTTTLDIVKPDSTDPEICVIEKVEENYEIGEVTIQIEGSDSDCDILYFCYSLDGGANYSELIAWPEATNSFAYTISIPTKTTPTIKVEIRNVFDLILESNELTYELFEYTEVEINDVEYEMQEETLFEEQELIQTTTADVSSDSKFNLSLYEGILAVVIILLVILFILLSIRLRKGIK